MAIVGTGNALRLHSMCHPRLALAMFFAAPLITGCGNPHIQDRQRELAQCRVASRSGDEVTRCLAVSKNWAAESALVAGLTFQLQLDSLESAMTAKAESAHRAQRAQAEAAAAGRARRWAECALRRFDLEAGGPVSEGEMEQSCGTKPDMRDLMAYVAARRPSLSDSLAHRLQLYVPEP